MACGFGSILPAFMSARRSRAPGRQPHSHQEPAHVVHGLGRESVRHLGPHAGKVAWRPFDGLVLVIGGIILSVVVVLAALATRSRAATAERTRTDLGSTSK